MADRSRRLAKRRGSIIVLVAVIFVAVLVMAGLVIDLGVSYMRSAKLQNAADSAAFAAATLLPIQTATSEGLIRRAEAEAMVRDYVLKNGDIADEVVGIDFEDIFTDDKEGPLYTSVRVRLQRQVNFLFGPIIGLDSKTTSRHAKVRVEAVIGDQKIAPLGISLDRRNATVAGESVAITFDTHDEEVINGNFGSLDLDGGGGGATEFFDDYVNGYDQDIIFNDPSHLVEGQTGVLLGKAKTAFETRYEACTHFPSQGGCTVDHYVASCPRIIIIVIHQRVTDNPPHRYLPLGYAPYILQAFEDKSLFVAPLTLHVKVGKSLPLTDMTYDFGLLRNRLVE
ncbi:MAG: pilus assembly protein TadG-related protein [Eubacteriales bacterium]|nr:pilus assembly protein TadG-related protein [Eubacteriales bacterium]